ncbi:type II toxin-antitoxin system ParD family antitoxin [Sphingomonas suaedae]|uniref:Type II toxin-antitoxin system ParD family antitoxin n=1 Tax=Sphingomonas suaedae TaxID=2599297 RepID=A0A518RD20_9SPHN|nr:type II toxin-antitoxin system ParD family antitoxin [Sphingomonas suaedae]QDX25367.1 type II toxin-antitoxin system ParD family antitoxin [Sphingomonas suaedae]
MPSSFTLGSHFEGFIKRQVSSGRYASASEVIRDSLRLLEEQEEERAAKLEALRADIAYGAASGEGIPADEVFAEVEAMIDEIARKKAG